MFAISLVLKEVYAVQVPVHELLLQKHWRERALIEAYLDALTAYENTAHLLTNQIRAFNPVGYKEDSKHYSINTAIFISFLFFLFFPPTKYEHRSFRFICVSAVNNVVPKQLREIQMLIRSPNERSEGDRGEEKLPKELGSAFARFVTHTFYAIYTCTEKYGGGLKKLNKTGY